MQRNISDWERAGSIVAATVLGGLAARRQDRRTPAMLAAGSLLLRGVSGYCPVSAAVGRNSRRTDSRQALSGARGVHVKESVTIARPLHEVYRFWRELPNLPRFMRHIERIEEIDRTRSHWTARGPAGTAVEWDAEIINEVPNQLIGWRSVGDAEVVSAGSVRFNPTSSGGTEIVVHLQYEPPAGKLGAWVASLFGQEPSQQIREDLGRLKAHLEAGGLVSNANEWQPSSRWSVPRYPTRSGRVRPYEQR
jgi:uncharacterized membrane protein